MTGNRIKSSTFILVLLALVFFFADNNDAAAEQLLEADCAVCHADIYGDGQLAARQTLHHNRAAEIGWGGLAFCNNCHGVGTNPVCTDCHGEPFEHQNETHAETSISNECLACHSSPQIAQETHNNNCYGCHTSSLPLVSSSIADGIGDPPAIPAIPQECNSCHTGTAGGAILHGLDEAAVASSHDKFDTSANCSSCHDSATAEQRLLLHPDCTTCHDNTNGAVTGAITAGRAGTTVDCESCHTTGGAVSHGITNATAASSHDKFNTSANCSSCHDSATAEQRLDLHPDCTTCHDSTNGAVTSAITAGRAGTTVDCESCHTSGGAVMHGTTNATAASSHDFFNDSANCSSCHNSATAEQRLALHPDCTTCHGNANGTVSAAITAGRGGTAVDCESCHTSGGAVVHGTTNATAASSHDFFNDSANCTSCHMTDTAEKRLDAHPDCTTCHNSANGAVSATIAAGRGGTAVDCESCHFAANTIKYHGLVASDVAGDHDNLAIPAPSNSCGDCHEFATAEVRINLHPDCTTCHTSSKTTVIATINAGKGATGTPQICKNCHNGPPEGPDNNAALLHGQRASDAGSSHDFFADSTDCTACHMTDTAEQRLLAHPISATNPNSDCATCHDSGNAMVMATITSGRNNTTVSCANCHSPANTIKYHGLATGDVASLHNNFMGSSTCGQCHVIGTVGQRIDVHSDCTTCHTSTDNNVINAINSAKGTSTTTVNCQTCHGDYGHPNALHTRITNLSTVCYDCHGQDLTPPPPNQAVDIIHKGDCLVCHTSTRSNVISAIAAGKAGATQLCTACHTPADYPEVDPQDHHIPAHDNVSAQEAVCKDCHDENVAVEHYVDRNVPCSTCHADPLIGPLVIEPSRGPNGTPIFCNTCHIATTMDTHKDGHDKTILPVDDTSCVGCHAANVAVEHVDNRGLACTVCHSSTDPNVQQVITNGSGFNGVTVNCSDCHGTIDHTAAHDMAMLDDPSCADCHAGNVVTEHVVNRGFECGGCHDVAIFQPIIDSGIAGNPVYCTTCHVSSDHTGAHNMTAVSDPSCNDCHEDDVSIEHVTNQGLACTVCHTSTDPLVIAAIDAGKGAFGTQVTCDACHANAGDHKPQHDFVGLPSIDCEACHADNVVTEHVEDRTYTCGTCHDSTDTLVQQTIADGRAGIQQDCYNCHTDTGGHEAAHDMTDVPSPDCTACHDANVATEHVTNQGLACTVCHSSTDQNVIDAIDKGKGPTGQTVYCTDCHMAVDHSASHSDTNVPEPLCQDCHDPNVFVEHVTVRNRDCSICHNPTYQGVIDDGVANTIEVTCTSCHVTPNHHNNDTARNGMCTNCHTNPLPLDNPPQQLACRQCHIDNNGYVQTSSPAPSHAYNTQANIQDFGACFACHAPMPFHAKPNQTPECWKIMQNSPYYDPTLAPGKDSFNLFARELQYPDDHWDGTQYDNLADQYCAPISRSDFWNPDVNFYWFPIVYQGQAMNMPAFDPANNFPPYPHNRINAVGNCGDCHTVGTVVSVTHNNNCVGCHLSRVKTIQDNISWARSGNDINCFDCHGEGGHAAQHDMTVLTQPSCSECHVDNVVTEHVDNRGLACSVCHDNPAYATVINNGKNGFTVTCFDCHGTADHLTLHAQTNVDEPGCADCHNPNVVTEHLANQGLDCVDCHESSDLDVIETIGGLNGSVTCSDCHGVTDHPSAHDNAGPSGGSNCTDCHAGNVVTEHVDNRGLTCGVCHDNPVYSGQITAGKAGSYQTCEDCHGPDAGDHAAAHDNAGTPSTGCNTCHNSNVVNEHVYDRGFTCGTCHDSTDSNVINAINTGKNGTMVTCYDCHGTNSHHATAESQAGDCTFCHADSRLDVDPNAPVGQLACRECHGSSQHNNGGPIQDFGACFACHQPTPYHAKPSSYQPCWKTISWVTSYYDPTLAPGKGTFNLFRSQFQRPEKYYKDTNYENYGDDYCDNNRDNFNSPAISFNWVTFTDIFGANQEWTVPTFGTGGGGPGGGNDSVTITYARYDRRRDRLTVYAENSMGNNAQLTIHYDGDTFNMDWDSSDDRWEDRVYDSRCRDSTIEVTSSAGGSDTATVDRCY